MPVGIGIVLGFLDEKGFVEHGVSCRCSWLTEKGEKLLLALEYMAKFNFELEEVYSNKNIQDFLDFPTAEITEDFY